MEDKMTTAVPVKKLPDDIVQLIHGLDAGESFTFIDESGNPEAVVVRIDRGEFDIEPKFRPIHDDWYEDWDRMAREIAAIWPKGQSAVEILSEMRR